MRYLARRYFPLVAMGLAVAGVALALGALAERRGWIDRAVALVAPPPAPQRPPSRVATAGDTQFAAVLININTHVINDAGVAKIDGDACLDVFTVNHSEPMSVLLNRGGGVFETSGFFNENPDIAIVRSPHDEGDQDAAFQILGTTLFPTIIASPTAPEDVRFIIQKPANPALQAHARKLNRKLLTLLAVHDAVVTPLEGDPGVVAFSAVLRPGGRVTFRSDMEGVWEIKVVSDGPPPQIYASPQFWRDGNVIRRPDNADIHGLVADDFDGDGDGDLLLVRGGKRGSLRYLPTRDHDYLALREATTTFRVVDPAMIGIQKGYCPARQVSLTDADNDGRSDAYIVCGRPEAFPNQLWRRDPARGFDDLAAEMGVAFEQNSGSRWADIDADGRLDLISVANGRLWVMRNTLSGFALIGEFKHNGGPNKLPALADYDADGDIDIAVPGLLRLLINDNGVLREAQAREQEGLDGGYAQAVAWVDYDSDGLLDLHVIPGGLYRQAAPGRFERTGFAAFGRASHPDAAMSNWFDANLDGRPDLFAAATLDAPKVGWRHVWEAGMLLNIGPSGRWLTLDLEGPPHNVNAIGAQVRVTSNGRTQLATPELREGSAYSHGNFGLHFGFGDAEVVERVEVRWPDGATLIAENVPTNRRLLAVHGETVFRDAPTTCDG